jgi:phosphoribosylanthranilate isomerase
VATWIKICGITRREDAAQAARLGADALGFVFHARSPRRCAPHAAAEIIRGLPAPVVSVGVWLDEEYAAVEREAREAGVQVVQTYVPDVAGELMQRGWRVILAVDPHRVGWLDAALSLPIKRLMLDRGRLQGPRDGTSLTAADIVTLRRHAPVVLAGGLTPTNVAAALRDLRPDGVDAASGVESAPGLKDLEKLEQFITEVRLWDATVTSDASADSSSPKR